jgi:hypothetical protein
MQRMQLQRRVESVLEMFAKMDTLRADSAMLSVCYLWYPKRASLPLKFSQHNSISLILPSKWRSASTKACHFYGDESRLGTFANSGMQFFYHFSFHRFSCQIVKDIFIREQKNAR